MGSNNPENRPPMSGALTYPASSQQSPVQRVAEQPRQPRSLQGLLRFAMEATKAEDAPGNTELGPMDDERRKFLEDALKSLTVNVAQVLENSIKVLTNSAKMNSIQLGDDLPDDVKNAFTVLLDYVDDLDVANDFYKMGGFAVFAICYGSENEEVRARASALLGTLCQNNPFCQARALECGLLNVLLNLMETERGTTLAKCLFAISCAVREFEPSCRELVAQGGCQSLLQLLAVPEPAARTKAAFLVRYFAQHYSEAKEQFVRANIVRTITGLIEKGRDESTEHLLSILQVMSDDLDPKVLTQCRDPSLKLETVLKNYLRRPELKDDRYCEEKEYCNELLNRLFIQPQRVDLVEEVADR
ncbi:unnamed protein product [Chrysodeixis includens]|uniref:Nucleotide exchange factor Fes1 domain-containing protein n=1 Tax=Chrysodeixis includens TaxID=689277 RepID=A0A9P0FVY5_CHRIL|nr:unnamed protein product [Chrysodeixis includens]